MMEDLVSLYLSDMQLAWAPSTLRSERHRLNAVAAELDGNPRRLWEHLLKTQKPYSRVTTWTRVTAFYDWCIENGHKQGPNPYQQFRTKFARLFKNQYRRRAPSILWTDALRRINQIPDPSVREKALELVRTGMRYSESFSYQNGCVVGKGDKVREVFLPNGTGISGYKGSYSTFCRKLARAGLKPHDLRKLFLNRLVEMGANTFELCEMAGWSNLDTARSYIQTNKSKLAQIAKRAAQEK